ncbi:phytanoyl-CoA dioxygenase family protein [Nocardia pseudovaccinii]|uniref:phytanoyl-CoA dioxygenase family protein n=1 Tax=Nocardia pseudovaccinii TaxID=189540 RepID=UPI0007C6B908|nr:phytanoyl-CoA dioxygenase family protein [Nocardia pseudovaccinii]
MTEQGLTTLLADASVEDVCRTIQRDGGVIVKDAVDSETLQGLWADMQPHFETTPYGEDPFSGTKTRRISGLVGKSRHLFPVLDHPLVNGAAEHFLAIPHPMWYGDMKISVPANYHIGVTQVIQIHPGEGFQPLHRDDSVFQWEHPTYGREARIQVMLAMSDFTAENGGTRVIPGSHAWDDERAPSQDEAFSTEMTAGSILMFIGSTFHGGGLNSSDAPRTGLTFAYDLGFLRQEENQYLAIPIEQVKTFPESIQRKLGYAACPPLMGWVEADGKMAEPMTLLQENGQARSLSDLDAVDANGNKIATTS